MKKMMKFVGTMILTATIIFLGLIAIDLWCIGVGKGTVSYGVARPTDGTIKIGVRTITTGPIGLVKRYHDEYLGGSWAEGTWIIDKINLDPYTESVHIM